MRLSMAKRKGDTGKNFESEIRRSLKGAKHIWWFRIQDTNDINRFVKIAVAEKQPADFFTVYRGRPIMLEAKTSRSLVSFPLYSQFSYYCSPFVSQLSIIPSFYSFFRLFIFSCSPILSYFIFFYPIFFSFLLDCSPTFILLHLFFFYHSFYILYSLRFI